MDPSKARPTFIGIDLSTLPDMSVIQLPPRLVIRLLDDPTVAGGKHLALCTEDGKLFGAQIACTVRSEVEAITEVTVTFLVDGQAIRFAEGDSGTPEITSECDDRGPGEA